MLARAGTVFANDNAPGAQAPAPAAPSISIEAFPGLCMGVTMLTSLSLHKIGYGSLTDDEGKALTAALLKNAMAWDLSTMLENPKAAAALDLGGCLIAILLPRIIAENQPKAAPHVVAEAA